MYLLIDKSCFSALYVEIFAERQDITCESIS